MDKIIKKVLTKIEDNGYEAYVAGGYVRDKIIGRISYDVDIATNALPKDLVKIFGVKSNNYGSLNLKIAKFNIDITTYRKEIKYEDSKLVKVSYINNLLEDIKRRDFTINTLCMNKDGLIIDSLNVRKDIDKRIVKMVGDPKTRLKDDPLRIMRAIRFATVLNFKLDEDLKKSIILNKEEVKKISKVKLRSELDKILLCNHYKNGLKLIEELELKKVLKLEYNGVIKTTDILGMYSQITKDTSLFTKREYNIITSLNEIKFIDEFTLYEKGIYLSLIKGEILGIPKADIYKIYNRMSLREDKPLKINANEIMAILDLKPGRKVKEIKEEIIKQILKNRLKNNNKKIKNYLQGKKKNEKQKFCN